MKTRYIFLMFWTKNHQNLQLRRCDGAGALRRRWGFTAAAMQGTFLQL